MNGLIKTRRNQQKLRKAHETQAEDETLYKDYTPLTIDKLLNTTILVDDLNKDLNIWLNAQTPFSFHICSHLLILTRRVMSFT